MTCPSDSVWSALSGMHTEPSPHSFSLRTEQGLPSTPATAGLPPSFDSTGEVRLPNTSFSVATFCVSEVEEEGGVVWGGAGSLLRKGQMEISGLLMNSADLQRSLSFASPMIFRYMSATWALVRAVSCAWRERLVTQDFGVRVGKSFRERGSFPSR